VARVGRGIGADFGDCTNFLQSFAFINGIAYNSGLLAMLSQNGRTAGFLKIT
jgi:hypothetical protein